MSNTVGYSLGGCTVGVRYTLTQGEDATGNAVAFSLQKCDPGCWNGDYRERRYWAQLPASATATSGTDYYGALAPDIKFQGGGTYRDICPTVCFCEGPVAEGETVVKFLGRYETRWMALLLEGGLIYYGRVDGTLIQAPLDLFPDPLSDTATHIALSFDANARPVFAYEDEGTIYVRRYVADVPTTYSWTGTDPCLFFNGVINSDDSQTDVVCYYLTAAGGALYARFQRENFGVGNLVLEDSGLDSLMAVDRGRGVLGPFMVIELLGKRIFAAVYPPWPAIVHDFGTQAMCIESVEYALVGVDCGTYLDPATQAITIDAIGYWALTVPISPATEPATQAIAIEGIAYSQMVVQLGSYTESATQGVALEAIDYPEVSVDAGTYAESATQAIAIEGVNYATA